MLETVRTEYLLLCTICVDCTRESAGFCDGEPSPVRRLWGQLCKRGGLTHDPFPEDIRLAWSDHPDTRLESIHTISSTRVEIVVVLVYTRMYKELNSLEPYTHTYMEKELKSFDFKLKRVFLFYLLF